MTTPPRQASPTATRHCSGSGPDADASFLRRILFGLIAATLVTGVMTAALTTRLPLHDTSIELAVAP